MQKSNFKEWNLQDIERTFGLVQVDELPILENLISYQYEAS